MARTADQLASTKRQPKALVAVPGTSLELLNEFRACRDEMAVLEARKKELAPLVLSLVPRGNDRDPKYTEAFTDANGAQMEYTVTEGRQDRRQPDAEKLTVELRAAGISDDDCMMLVPDPHKVTVLLDAGRLKPAAFERSLVGPIVTYPDVRVRKAK